MEEGKEEPQAESLTAWEPTEAPSDHREEGLKELGFVPWPTGHKKDGPRCRLGCKHAESSHMFSTVSVSQCGGVEGNCLVCQKAAREMVAQLALETVKQ
jgi:hypothetical protein